MLPSASLPQSQEDSTLDRECGTLLPRVCELLAASGSSLPDDTSLEKLLDWFTQLSKSGTSLHESFPCLLKFIFTVINNTALDPAVLSFMIKLTGLMAATEEGYQILQDHSCLDQVFNIKHWQESGLWEDPSVKCGWIQGLKSMMHHARALSFFIRSELTEHLLQLQTDPSLFVASAANQLLAHILLFFQCKSLIENGYDHNNDDEARTPLAEYNAVVITICAYFKDSLLPKEQKHLHQTAQVLKLVAQILSQASPPLRNQLFEAVCGSLDAQVTAGYSQLTSPLMEVILAAHSLSYDEQRVRLLLSAMLEVSHPTMRIRAAAAVLHKGICDPVYTPKAVRILLFPLDIVTGMSALGSDTADQAWCKTKEQLKNRSFCSSMICTCLTNLPQVILLPADFLPCSLALIVSSVVSLLHMSIGDSSSSSSSAGCTETFRNIFESGKIQKCALDALTALSSCSDVSNKVNEVFTVLLVYLNNPDPDPTVLHKCYQAVLKWTCVCTDQCSVSAQLKQALLQVVCKRACDLRWEVRDSTVEFLGQQAALSDSMDPAQNLLLEECSTIPLLWAALQDQESYVRASAVSALAQTLKKSWKLGAAVSPEQTDIVTKLLNILSEDTEGFSRRAVVRYIICWFASAQSHSSSSSPPPPLLMKSVASVLTQGSADLDWEVKVHTLELAEMLINAAFSGHTKPSHPYAVMSQPTYLFSSQNSGICFEDALSNLVEWRVISAVLSGIFDCDRPVALKACQLLMKLRETLNTTALETKVKCGLPSWGWGQEIRALMGNLNGTDEASGALVNVHEVLRRLSLEERLDVLSQSSDHVQNSPLSLLQDILTARDVHSHSDTAEDQEVVVDCY